MKKIENSYITYEIDYDELTRKLELNGIISHIMPYNNKNILKIVME